MVKNNLNEYDIWNNIFNSNLYEDISRLIKLVIIDEDARTLVTNKICNLKNIEQSKKIIGIKITIDEDSINNEKIEELSNYISKQIIETINKK